MLKSTSLSVVFLVFILSLSFYSTNLWAASFWGNIKTGLHQVLDILDTRDPSDETAPLTSPEDIAADWDATFVQEPVFGSKMLKVEAGKSNPQSVILIHGLGQNGFKDWLQTITFLAPDYHIIAVDLPGFGHSEKPKATYSPTNYAKIIHWLNIEFAHEKPIVIGHSMGGAVALRYSHSFPMEISKLVLVDAAGILQRTAFIKHSAGMVVGISGMPDGLERMLLNAKDIGESIIETSAMHSDEGTFLSLGGELVRFLTDSPNANAAVALVEENYSEAVAQLQVPTYIIWGTLDTIAPLRTGKVLSQRLQSAELHLIKGAGHVPMKTHTGPFLKKLDQILRSTGISKKKAKKTLPFNGDLRCKNKSGLRYSGSYKNVYIDNCVGIKLIDVHAKYLHLHRSIVDIIDSSFISDAVSLQAEWSVVNATNVTFSGKIAVTADSSRFDFAGARLDGSNQALAVKGKSKLIFSLSTLSSPIYDGLTHDVFILANTGLDNALVNRSR